ncbi:MAG TPA: pyrroline-5-carboxylate reductase [Opitutaceae bacterium]|nr:pyrroline-5-carboxylate reductase [Opitutaceae bacterium]
MPRFAFVGAGRMASAMVGGLLGRKVAVAADIACIGGEDDTARVLARRTGITAHADLAPLLATADTVVLACKPQQLAGLDPRLADLTAGRLVISILAGKRLARLTRTFPRARNLVRAMPNTPGQIGAGITAWCALRPPEAADRRLIDMVLGALGQVVELQELHLDAVTAVSGSGPAFLFEFVAAMRDGGVSAGLPREVAARLATETVLGSARLLAETKAEPEALRDQVTSPHGTTHAGLQRMAARGFRDTMRETILAARARSEELSQDD